MKRQHYFGCQQQSDEGKNPDEKKRGEETKDEPGDETPAQGCEPVVASHPVPAPESV